MNWERALAFVGRGRALSGAEGEREFSAAPGAVGRNRKSDLGRARETSTQAVQAYNTAVRSFPTVLFAGMLGFPPKPFFNAQPGAEKAPTVNFDFGKTSPAPVNRVASASERLESGRHALILTLALTPTPPFDSMIRLARLFVGVLVLLGLGASLGKAETLPSKPDRLFQRLRRNRRSCDGLAPQRKLAQFERETSTQIVVAIYRTMQSESSVDDYTQRVAKTWGVGQQGRNNGAVLFVFVENRQMFIQTGYGLEGRCRTQSASTSRITSSPRVSKSVITRAGSRPA